MKYSLLLLLITFIASVRADDAVKLHCPTRGDLTVSFFNYNLMTMKWGDHFQIAAGKERSKTKAGVPFWSTNFSNGDSLAYFPDSEQYFLFYAGADAPERCNEVGSFIYPVITPPRYDSHASAPQSQASATEKEVILLHPSA